MDSTLAQPSDITGIDGKTLFGHPRGLAFLAFTEAWERFSFYGMQGLLLLYMIQELLLPGVAPNVAGLAGLRSGIEAVTGPLSNQAFASQVFGLYSGFVYFTPVFGGLIADRWLGQRRTVMAGAVMMAAGHLLMATYGGFLIALVLLVIGTGCLKGNISAQVGHLYAPHDEAGRTRAFAIFSAAINFGALAGPLFCGILAQAYGWHVGFATAGVLMLAALVTYASGRRYLPPDRIRRRSDEALPPLTRHERKVVAVLLALTVIAVLPSAAYYQETNSVLLLIEESVRRGLGGWTVPTASFNSLDGLFCMIVVPPLIALWRWQASRGREPGDLAKIAIGFGLTALANAIMIVPAGWTDGGAKISAAWPVLLFFLNAVGFIYYWPTLLALFSSTAPRAINSTMMGVLFLAIFAGNLLVGTLGTLWETMSHARFFALHAGIALGPAVLMALVARPLARLLAVRDDPPEDMPAPVAG